MCFENVWFIILLKDVWLLSIVYWANWEIGESEGYRRRSFDRDFVGTFILMLLIN